MVTTVTAPRRVLPLAATAIGALAVVVIAALVVALPSLRTPARTSSASGEADLAVVRAYFAALNAAMKSGDFSNMSTVMAPDVIATLNNPQGQTGIHRGLADYTAYLQTLQKTLAGYQWTTDDLRVLGPGVVLAYEHAGSPPLTVAGRCEHVFRIENGKITRYDWTTFYPGVK